jgi:hypothetical protein
MLEVSLDCPFLIGPSVFSNVYLKYSCVHFFAFKTKLFFFTGTHIEVQGHHPNQGVKENYRRHLFPLLKKHQMMRKKMQIMTI